jgi:hypothetical protein
LFKKLVYFPELRVQERFPAGDEQAQSLKLVEFLQDARNVLKGQVERFGVAKETVCAPEITARGYVKKQIPKRRDGRLVCLSLRDIVGDMRKYSLSDAIAQELDVDRNDLGAVYLDGQASDKLESFVVKLIELITNAVIDARFFE